MSTILRLHGFEVMIYSRDHAPPHVHVWRSGTELVVDLEPLGIRENNRMMPKNARKAFEIVAEHQAKLLTEWQRFHP